MASPSDQLELNYRMGYSVRFAGQLGILTDGLIAPLTTTAGLLALYDSATLKGDEVPMRVRLKEGCQAAIDAGFFTDGTVAAANTIEGLVTLTGAPDAARIFLWGE